jgi:raffinose/stachyose/melibiose transport system permease protein
MTQEKKSGAHRRTEHPLTIVLFLLPALILFTIFVILPVINSVYTSLFKWNGLGPLDDFIGLKNYARLIKHTPFIKALTHNLVVIVLSLGIQLPMALGLALLVGRKLPGRVFFRTIFFLPFVIAQAITAYLWAFIFNPRFSMILAINNIIHTLYPPFDPAKDWLGNVDRVLIAIFVVLTWQFFGLHMILYIAGLQQISEEVEEAARIDGASRLQNLRYIIIPMLSSTIITTIYLSVLGSLQQFALVWLMTEGGPANASELMTTYMYRYGFVSFQLGYGAAVAFVIFLICLIFSLGYQRMVMRQQYAGRVT